MEKLRKDTIEFLSMLDGYHEVCKGLHWSADRHSKHILTDDIDGAVLEYQDKIAEVVMGMIDDKFEVGELKALTSDAKDCKAMLEELESDTLNYKKEIGDEPKVAAIHNVIDDLLTDINKWKYLDTLS
jgi:hypothetical protein